MLAQKNFVKKQGDLSSVASFEFSSAALCVSLRSLR
jgi:hypothetical protein